MQGDCLSAVLFIYYLAKCLKEEQTQMYGFYLCPKYADDITWFIYYFKTLSYITRNDFHDDFYHGIYKVVRE